MPFAAALSTIEPTLQAIEEVCEQGRALLAGSVDLAVLFFSTHHIRAADVLARTVQHRLRAALSARLRRRVRHRRRPGDRAESGRESVDQPLGAGR